MNITLINRTHSLLTQRSNAFELQLGSPLKQELLKRYVLAVHDELSGILAQSDDDEHKAQLLKKYLAENHKRVKGSRLDYTALPDHPVTKLLVLIADQLAEHHRFDGSVVAPLQLLYPNLALSSASDLYLDLGTIELPAPFSLEEQQQRARLNRLYQKQFDQDQKHYLRVKELQERLATRKQLLTTSLKEDIKSTIVTKMQKDQEELSSLMNNKNPNFMAEFRDFLALEGKEKHIQSAKKLEQNGFYRKIQGNILIPKDTGLILRTHILSDEHDSLIPLQQLGAAISLSSDEEGSTLVAWCHDPVYLVYAHEEQSLRTLSPSEYQRMAEFSDDSLTFIQAARQYANFMADESHLYGHLLKLRERLRHNDAHVGIGQADQAGEGAYIAIVEFKRYYDQLDDSIKVQIPDSVVLEISRLFHLSSTEREINEQTCIGLRGEALERLLNIEFIKNKLTQLGVNKSQFGETKLEYENDLCIALRRFNDSLRESKPLFGDSLPITLNLLESFQLEFPLNSLSQFNELMKMQEKDILGLVVHDEQKAQLAQQFDLIGNFKDFIQTTAMGPLNRYFELTREHGHLFPIHVHRGDIPKLLVELHPEKLLLCLAYPAFNQYYPTASDVIQLLNLFPEQALDIIRLLPKFNHEVIRSVSDFHILWTQPSQDQRSKELVFTMFLPQLISWIHSLNDYQKLIKILPSGMKRRLSQEIIHRASEWIDDKHAYVQWNSYLNRADRTRLFLTLHQSRPEILHSLNVQELIRIKHSLSATKEHFDLILREYIVPKIDSMTKFNNLIYDMDDKKCKELLSMKEDALQQWLLQSTNPSELFLGISRTSTIKLLAQFVTDKRPDVLTNPKILLGMLNVLNEKQGCWWMHRYQARMKALLKQPRAFIEVFKSLEKSSQQQAMLFKLLKDELPLILEHNQDYPEYYLYLNILPDDCIHEVLGHVKSNVLASLTTFPDLCSFLQKLNPSIREQLVQEVEVESLNADAILTLMDLLRPERAKTWILQILPKISQGVAELKVFRRMYETLEEGTFELLMVHLKPHWNLMISKDPAIFLNIYGLLREGDKSIFFDDLIPEVQNVGELKKSRFFNELIDEHQKFILNKTKLVSGCTKIPEVDEMPPEPIVLEGEHDEPKVQEAPMISTKDICDKYRQVISKFMEFKKNYDPDSNEYHLMTQFSELVNQLIDLNQQTYSSTTDELDHNLKSTILDQGQRSFQRTPALLRALVDVLMCIVFPVALYRRYQSPEHCFFYFGKPEKTRRLQALEQVINS